MTRIDGDGGENFSARSFAAFDSDYGAWSRDLVPYLPKSNDRRQCLLPPDSTISANDAIRGRPEQGDVHVAVLDRNTTQLIAARKAASTGLTFAIVLWSLYCCLPSTAAFINCCFDDKDDKDNDKDTQKHHRHHHETAVPPGWSVVEETTNSSPPPTTSVDVEPQINNDDQNNNNDDDNNNVSIDDKQTTTDDNLSLIHI